MRHERDSGSKNVMVSIPLLPLRVAYQNSSIPTPLGLIAPNPVTTTRRRFGWPLFPFILTLHTAKCFTSSITPRGRSVKVDGQNETRHSRLAVAAAQKFFAASGKCAALSQRG